LVGVNYEENSIAGIRNTYFTFYGGEFVRYFPHALASGVSIGAELDWQNAELQILAL